MPHAFTIDTDFPGGNVIVDSIAGDDVYLHQDLRDTDGHWFYWSFRVEGAAGRRITFHFTQGKVIGAKGPAVNAGDGGGWYWDEQYGSNDHSFSFDFGPDHDSVHFAFGIPYTERDLHAFLARHEGHRALDVISLCQTRKGRNVELLRIAPESAQPSFRVLLTARHHACEAMASYALEGFLEEVLSDAPAATWIRSSVEILAVPILDKDGVEDGDQGKNRRPHDHNRDYRGASVCPEIAALRDLVPGWSHGKLTVALDFHCPARAGDGHEHIHFVEPECDSHCDPWTEIQAYSRLIEADNPGPLPFTGAGNLRFGERWNVADAHHTNFSSWAMGFDEVALAATFELPYASVRGVRVTAAEARPFGATMARALHPYLAGRQ